MDPRKIYSFIKRDFREFISYPLSALFTFLSVFLTLFIFFYLSRVISPGSSILKYSGDYFSFVIIGIAFSSAATSGLNTIVSALRNEEMKGTLEILLSGRVKTIDVLTGLMSFNIIFELFRMLFILVLSAVFFGLKIHYDKIYVSIIFLLLTFFTFLSLGIISGGIILITKKGNPLSFLVNQANLLFSGVYFPYEILPLWLKVFSFAFPTTYALKAIRLNLLQGYGFDRLYGELFILIGFAAVLLPASVVFFDQALKLCKKWGSLNTY